MIAIIDLNFLGSAETIASFLIKTTEGPILIETGPHSTLPQLISGLATYGYTIDDIKHVFITHIHLDHAGAAWVFAAHGATIYLHPLGEKHLAEPSKLMNSARMIYKDDMDRLWGEMKSIAPERLKVMQHEEVIMIGDTPIKALHTPGHAVHHIAWQIESNLFAGDVAGVKINEGPVMPPCPPPDINVEDWKSSIALINSLKIKKIYLTHFGIITKIKLHLIELERRLDNWATWMQPYAAASDTDPKELTPIFQAYVRQQLLDNGLDDATIDLYEKANPSWMSVAGLLRYWSKKNKV